MNGYDLSQEYVKKLSEFINESPTEHFVHVFLAVAQTYFFAKKSIQETFEPEKLKEVLKCIDDLEEEISKIERPKNA